MEEEEGTRREQKDKWGVRKESTSGWRKAGDLVVSLTESYQQKKGKWSMEDLNERLTGLAEATKQPSQSP